MPKRERRFGDKKTTIPEGKTDYQREYMREYRARKKAKREQLEAEYERLEKLLSLYDTLIEEITTKTKQLKMLNSKIDSTPVEDTATRLNLSEQREIVSDQLAQLIERAQISKRESS